MKTFVIFLLFLHHVYSDDTLHENTEDIIDVSSAERRYFLQVASTDSPFFLYITPCGNPIHWQLFSMEKGATVTEAQDDAVSLIDSPNFKLIAGEEDTNRMTFFAHHLPSEVILVISSPLPSTARIFFTPSLWRIEEQYPPLPHDVRVATTPMVTEEPEASALITWKIAPKVRNAEESRYRFCAIVSRKEPTWASCDHLDEGVQAIRCVSQTNNSVVLDALRPGRKYFITVFVRDYKHGTSSTYETVTMTTDRRPKEKVRTQRRVKKSQPRYLINSKLQGGQLEARRGAYVNYRFQVPEADLKKGHSALFIIHACDGLVRTNIFRKGKLLKKTEPFSGFRRFVVSNIQDGHLRFQVVNDNDKHKTIRVWASTNSSTSPYPMLPDDTSIKVMKRTCTTATLQWIRVFDESVRYCVYKRKEVSNFLEHLVSLADNLCEGGLSSSTLVGCYTHHPSGQNAALIETTVTGLQAGSTYRFDLLATPLNRMSAQALPYRTVWAKTSEC